jgi:hypothetical protein
VELLEVDDFFVVDFFADDLVVALFLAVELLALDCCASAGIVATQRANTAPAHSCRPSRCRVGNDGIRAS